MGHEMFLLLEIKKSIGQPVVALHVGLLLLVRLTSKVKGEDQGDNDGGRREEVALSEILYQETLERQDFLLTE